MNYILLIAVFIASVFISRVVHHFALARNIIDIPNERSLHTGLTPRGGGLAFIIPFLVTLVILYLNHSIYKDLFLPFWIGGLLVAGIGFLDDIFKINPLQRTVVHFVAVLWSLITLGKIPPLSLGFATIHWGIIGSAVSLIGIIWMINLYNFMDGIDGLAASEGVFVAGVTGIILYFNKVYDLAWINLVLAAGCAGFLVWNWAPARVFMGDVGSGFLGFVIGLSAIANLDIQELAIWIWLILLGLFVVDTLLTLVRRALRGEKLYEAHRTHAYQHATIRYQSHALVTLSMIGINVFWLLPWALVVWVWPQLSIIVTVIALTPLTILALYFGAGKELY